MLKLKNIFNIRWVFIVETFVIVVVIIIGEWAIASINEKFVLQKAEDNFKSHARLLIGMVDCYNGSLKQQAERLCDIFISNYPGKFRLDTSSTVMINRLETPVLRSGSKAVNLNFDAVDNFTKETGAVATIFVKHGNDFVRITTSVKREDFTRAIGTFLGKDHPAYEKLKSGNSYTGKAMLFGRTYMTRYVPIKGPDNAVIGIFFIGYDFTYDLKALTDKIRAVRFGETSEVFVIDASQTKEQGTLVVHQLHENKNVFGVLDIAQQRIIHEMMDTIDGVKVFPWKYRDDAKQTMRLFAYATYVDWDWLIVESVAMDELSREITFMKYVMIMGNMIIAGILITSMFIIKKPYFPEKK